MVEVKDIIFNAPEKDIESIILNIADKDQADQFLEYIMSIFKELKSTNKYSDRIKILMVAFLKTWPSLSSSDSEYYLFYARVSILRNLVQILLETFSDEKERNEILILIFANEDISLGIKANILIMLGDEHNKYINKERERIVEHRQLSIENLDILEGNFAQTLLKASLDNLLDDIYFFFIKQFWESFQNSDSKKAFDNFILEISKNTSSIKAKFISALIDNGKCYGTVNSNLWSVNYKKIGEYIDIEESIDQMKAFAVSPEFSKLLLRQQEDIIAFIIFETLSTIDKTLSTINKEMLIGSVTKTMIDDYAKNNNIVLNQ